jgi:hypothetical protein
MGHLTPDHCPELKTTRMLGAGPYNQGEIESGGDGTINVASEDRKLSFCSY